jgi:hypothetical protein
MAVSSKGKLAELVKSCVGVSPSVVIAPVVTPVVAIFFACTSFIVTGVVVVVVVVLVAGGVVHVHRFLFSRSAILAFVFSFW